MNSSPSQTQLSENLAVEFSLSCGLSSPAPLESKSSGAVPEDKSVYWLVFWAAFVLSPFLSLMVASYPRYAVEILTPVLCAMTAGFSLAKFLTHNPKKCIIIGFLFTLGVLAIDFAIVFVADQIVLMARGADIRKPE
jgi:hypothetical protein